MDPDVVFIVNYSCPRCQAALEARVGGVPGWLRCPACGRASLPPEHNRIAPPPFVDDRTLILGNFTTGGAAASLPLRPRPMVALPPRRPAPATPTTRLILGSGVFLSTALFVFSLLDSSRGRSVIFGLAAAACLVLLTRQSKRPPAP